MYYSVSTGSQHHSLTSEPIENLTIPGFGGSSELSITCGILRDIIAITLWAGPHESS